MARLRSSQPIAPIPLPLKLRLRAWWEGYDLAALTQRLAAARPESPARRPDPRDTASPDFAALGSLAGLGALAAPESDWTEARLAAAQLIWGTGLLGPHDDAATTDLTRLLKLRRGMRVIHLGAQLGGLGRQLERSHGCRVVNFETDARLLEGAARIGNRIQPFGPELKRDGRPFHHAIVDGLAHRTGDFEGALRRLRPLLLDQASVVIRAYVLRDESAITGDRYRSWAATEPIRLSLVTQEELVARVQQAGFGLRGSEDRSAAHVEAVERAWRGAVAMVYSLHADPNARPMIPLLLREGELWQRRLELIRDKTIAAVRFLVVRRDRPMQMLSDW